MLLRSRIGTLETILGMFVLIILRTGAAHGWYPEGVLRKLHIFYRNLVVIRRQNNPMVIRQLDFLYINIALVLLFSVKY